MREMTIAEVLQDPLIGQLLRADRVAVAAFADLLEEAARLYVPIRLANDENHANGSAVEPLDHSYLLM